MVPVLRACKKKRNVRGNSSHERSIIPSPTGRVARSTSDEVNRRSRQIFGKVSGSTRRIPSRSGPGYAGSTKMGISSGRLKANASTLALAAIVLGALYRQVLTRLASHTTERVVVGG